MYPYVYDRQVRTSIFKDSGLMEKIRRTRILIPGCGALGSAVAHLALRMGFRRLRIVDHDFLDPSNYPRTTSTGLLQSLSGEPKVLACMDTLLAIDPYAEVEGVYAKISWANIGSLVEGVDVVMDGLDNLSSRLIVASEAWRKRVPYIYTGVNDRYFNVMPFIPGVTPCFECVIGRPSGEEKGGFPVLVSTVYAAASYALMYLISILKGEKRSEMLVGDVYSMTLDKVEVKDSGCKCNPAVDVGDCYVEQQPREKTSFYTSLTRWDLESRRRILESVDCRTLWENTWLTIGYCGNSCEARVFVDGRIELDGDCSGVAGRIGGLVGCRE